MKYQAGVSLVQLLISTMLGLLLSTALLNMLYATILSNQLKLAIETVQENSALAGYFLRRDLNGIGFKSCFEQPLSHLNILSKGSVAGLLNSSAYPQGIKNQYKQSDAISFITVLDAPAELINDMATVHASVDLAAKTKLKEGQEILITDCESADLFKVSSIWNYRLTHDAIDNVDANLSVSYARGSLVYPLTRISYKLAKGVSGRTGLYRKVNSSRYQELIPNVQQMRIFYGLRNKLERKVTYQRANAALDLSGLVSLRIELVLMSARAVLRHKMYYQNTVGEKIQASDKRFYKYHQLIIALRNSLYVQG